MSYRALFFFAIAAALVAAIPGAVAADDGLPTVAALEDKLRTAHGTLAPQYRETIVETNSAGGTSAEVYLRRGDDERTTWDSGPLHTGSGTSAGRWWDMDENGIVTVGETGVNAAPAEGSVALVDDTRDDTHVERATNGPDLVLVSQTPQGYVRRQIVDPTSWTVVRIERFAGKRALSVTTSDDVRTDNGRTFAHHWHTEDLLAHAWTDDHVTAYTPTTITASDVTMPANRRQLVTFPTGATSVDLPATFTDEEIVVRVRINHRGLDLVLDSGSSGIVLDKNVVASLGLPTHDPHFETNAGSYSAAQSIVPEMTIGSLTLRDVAVDVLPESNEQNETVKTVGLLGYDFFAQLALRIDYTGQKVTAIMPTAFVPPTQSDTVELTTDLEQHVPRITLGINGVHTDRWIVDTGNWSQLIVAPPFARAHPDVLQNERGYKKLLDVDYQGVGGSFDTRWYELADLDLGGFHLQGARADVVIQNGIYENGDDGAIGGELLSYFTLVFDDPQHRLYLIPNH
jgi:predicted aspartyl protease